MIESEPPRQLYLREIPQRNNPSLFGPKVRHDSVELRTKSFIYAPPLVRRYKSSLIENGFSFIGKSSEIKCFSCGKLSDIKDENMLKDLNLLHSDKCKFRKNVENKPKRLVLDEVDGKLENQSDRSESLKDLEKDIESLRAENEKLRNIWICKKCKKERIQTLFLPCRHFITCEACAESSDYCLHCFEKILGTVRTYKV